MRVVLQRVLSASVVINDNIFSSIDSGLLILVGIESIDKDDDIEWLVNKIVNLRIFNDDEGKMNLSGKDVGGEYLVISQFTLHGSTKKGNRPSYIKAARPEYAILLYEKFVERLRKVSNNNVKTGVFAADMKVNLINDGPVTIVIDSKQKE